jgi:hypothetical protein
MKVNQLALLGILGVTLATAGCTTAKARYTTSPDNTKILQAYQGKAISMTSMQAPAAPDIDCRVTNGPIKTADGSSLPDFVKNAFNDELKHAGIYGTHNGTLTGRINKISLSTSSSHWVLSLTVISTNGKSLTVEDRYEFTGGPDVWTSCTNATHALTPAVQSVIKKTVSDPGFKDLMN